MSKAKERKTDQNKLASTMVVKSEISAGDMMMNRCKKHPKHKQSSGVCSFCLRERLSQLFVISSSSKNQKHNNKITTASSSYSSSISSTSSSDDEDDDEDDDSPTYSHHVRGGRMSSTKSSMNVPVSYLIKCGSSITKNDVGMFTRSRSMAVVPKNWIDESNIELKTKTKKKGGFWSKLLWSSSKKKDVKKEVVLMHSRTVREMPINSFL